MEFIEIKDGINLKVIKSDKFKTICFAILIRTSLNRKNVTFNSMIPNLLLNGCEKYKTIREINLKTEEMYGSNFYADVMKKGDNQILEFLFEVSNSFEDLSEIIDFLTNIILKPLKEQNSFKKEYFEKARAFTIDKIKTNENNKQELAKNRCISKMFQNEDFGVICDGYIEDFEENNISEETLYKHYKKLLEESEIDIIVVGDIFEKEIENLIRKYFIIENRNYKKIQNNFIEKNISNTNFFEEKFNITQGKLCMGYRSNIKPYSDYFLPLVVGNEILGGGASSKLFNNVREKQSLCYYINSFVFIFKGVIFVQAGIDFKEYKKVVECIKKEIENLKLGNFTDNDLQKAILSLEKKYLSILDNNTSIMDYYYTNFLADTVMDIKQTINAIKKVKKDEVQEVFKKIWLDTVYFMKGE